MEHEDNNMDIASIRAIFIACDVDKTDQVPVSKLIDYIKPFFMEKQKALEDLRQSLDPEGKNALINSDDFHEVMGTWCQKMRSSASDSFSKTPNTSLLDDKVPSFLHSTPRPSLGNRLTEFGNLSVGSAYSLSGSKLIDSTDKIDKNVLEERIKELEHSLWKTNSELLTTKQQLLTLEEQHEALQKDFERQSRRLNAEQQVNEHLQKQKENSDEMRDELNNCKRQMEEVKKKFHQTKEDAKYNKILVEELEQEKTKLEKRVDLLTKQNQECTKDLISLTDELEAQKMLVIAGNQNYEDLRLKFVQQNDIIDELREEVKVLRSEKTTLERCFSNEDARVADSNGDVPLLFETIAAESATKNNSLMLFEKDEQIFRLEEELEKQKSECNELKKAKSVSNRETEPKIDVEVQTCNAHWCEIVALEEEINELKKRPEDSSESKVKELTELCATLSIEKEELEVNFEALKKEYEEAVEKRDDLHNLVEQIQKHIDQKNILIEEMRELNNKASRSLDAAQEDLKNKVNLILSMRNDKAEDIEIKNRLWENNKVLLKEVAHLTASNTSLSEEHNKLVELLKTNEIEYNNVLMMLDQETAKNVELSKRIDQLSEVVQLNAVMSTSLKEIEDNVRHKDEEIEQLRLEEQKLHQQLSETTTEVAQLKEKLQQYEAAQKSLEDNKKLADCHGKKPKAPPRRTFARQEALVEKLQLKIDDLEGKLNAQKATIGDLTQELVKLQTLLSEKEVQVAALQEELTTACDQLNRNMLKKNCNVTYRETKSVNKFTICSAKFQSDVRNHTEPLNEGLVEQQVPSLIITHTTDALLEDLDLNNEKQPLTKEETESKVTCLVLQLRVSSENLPNRLQSQTDRYKSKYEQVLGMLGDISHRLRDHVCIGTAEPIKPVFVLLEEVKLQLAELVQCAGAMGGLVYEDRMKCCWKLASDYMTMLREENEALLRISRETISTQTSASAKQRKAIKDKCQGPDEPSTKSSSRSRRCPTLKLFGITVSVLVLAVCFVLHVMATCEERHCPFDGLINAINFGLPPM